VRPAVGGFWTSNSRKSELIALFTSTREKSFEIVGEPIPETS